MSCNRWYLLRTYYFSLEKKFKKLKASFLLNQLIMPSSQSRSGQLSLCYTEPIVFTIGYLSQLDADLSRFFCCIFNKRSTSGYWAGTAAMISCPHDFPKPKHFAVVKFTAQCFDEKMCFLRWWLSSDDLFFSLNCLIFLIHFKL